MIALYIIIVRGLLVQDVQNCKTEGMISAHQINLLLPNFMGVFMHVIKDINDHKDQLYHVILNSKNKRGVNVWKKVKLDVKKLE